MSVYFPYCECMCIKSCIEKVVSLRDELRTCWLCSVQVGAVPRGGGWIGWLANSHKQHNLLHSLHDGGRTLTAARALGLITCPNEIYLLEIPRRASALATTLPFISLDQLLLC